jgi:hypothetical protein
VESDDEEEPSPETNVTTRGVEESKQDNYFAPQEAKPPALAIMNTKPDSYMSPPNVKPTPMKMPNEVLPTKSIALLPTQVAGNVQDISAITMEKSSSSESALEFQYQMGEQAHQKELATLGKVAATTEMMSPPFDHVPKPPPAKLKYPIEQQQDPFTPDIDALGWLTNDLSQFQIEDMPNDEATYATQDLAVQSSDTFTPLSLEEPIVEEEDSKPPAVEVIPKDDDFKVVERKKRGQRGNRNKPPKKPVGLCALLSPSYAQAASSSGSSQSSNGSTPSQKRPNLSANTHNVAGPKDFAKAGSR